MSYDRTLIYIGTRKHLGSFSTSIEHVHHLYRLIPVRQLGIKNVFGRILPPGRTTAPKDRNSK